MRDFWLKLVAGVLRPVRPRLEACLRERDRHLEASRILAEERARAIARSVARIETLRAEVFAAKDGVVTPQMTESEREWRWLSRPDPDGELMDFWARIAPRSWIDRKRWRDSDAVARVDAAALLASDVEAIEAAEAAVDALRVALAAWGTPIGARVRWRSFERDFEGIPELLAKPLRAARDALSSRDGASVALERAEQLERAVLESAKARFPERALLARGLAHAAFVDYVWRAASLAERPNPVAPLCDLWKTGYLLSTVDGHDVVIELPRV